MKHARFSLFGLVALTSVFLAAGCAGSLTGSAEASASVSVEAGYFFGHDLRSEQSVVYVLDLSGSMSANSGSVAEQAGTDLAGEAAGGVTGRFLGKGAGNAVEDRVKRLKKKIEKVKLHLIASLQGLPQGSQFNVILFSDGVQTLSPGMILTSGASKAAVGVFVDQLEEGGSTNMYAALEAALYTPARHIILLTDGLPTSTSSGAVLDLAARQNDGTRIISTVGVGGGQAREFLATLANENGGNYTMYD